MKPVFKVLANGQDITALLADRLESLQVVDKAGLDSDELTITLDDRDGAVGLPARGAVLEVSLGYAETGLSPHRPLSCRRSEKQWSAAAGVV